MLWKGGISFQAMTLHIYVFRSADRNLKASELAILCICVLPVSIPHQQKSTLPESGDSWMYPYQRTPMGNPYINLYKAYIVGIYG